MAGTGDLPEEIMLDIFSRLPVKSLIRFTCVSKRVRSIILFDPKFAESQLKASRQKKTLNRRFLFNTDVFQPPLSYTPSFGDPRFSFNTSVSKVNLLGSCNGLVFVAADDKLFYIYNPSTGLLKQLPDRSFSSHQYYYYGAGYLPATDDYKVLVAAPQSHQYGTKSEVFLFSLRSHIWERIESLRRTLSSYALVSDQQGTLFNEVLHWPKSDIVPDPKNEIVCFDLAKEVFRRMRLPKFGHSSSLSSINIGVCGGYLCVSVLEILFGDSIDFWIMTEYDSSDSWTMIYRLFDSTALPEWPKCIRDSESS